MSTPKPKNTISEIFNSYTRYKEESLTNRRFKHKDILILIEKLKTDTDFIISEVGMSVEGKLIQLISVGKGKTNILVWSQMHGDEPTATMAIFDILNFLKEKDRFTEFKKNVLENVTLSFLPVLNPDGTDKFKRRNSLNIDLNRDAIALQSPEATLLKTVQEKLKPDFGFNMHDQDIRYAVGETGKSASISFLAPPIDPEGTINETRENAMKVIVSLTKLLEAFVPGQIGKWPSDFEPRAFGENMQMWGTSTILVEAGFSPNDYEKQFLRKLHFILLIQAFETIAKRSYLTEELKVYDDIPLNSKRFFDFIIRNAAIVKNNKIFKVDIGINRYETTHMEGFYFKSKIEEIGDMSIFHGFHEFDAKGLEVVTGKFAPQTIPYAELTYDKVLSLLKNGFTSVHVKDLPPNIIFSDVPINLALTRDQDWEEIDIDNKADLVLKEGQTVKFVVVNGYLFDVENGVGEVMNGLII